MKDDDFIPTMGKGKGTWCAGVARRGGKLLYCFPVASSFADHWFEYKITDAHLRVLQSDEERFFLLFAAMHDTHQLKPHPPAKVVAHIFDTILLAKREAVLEFVADEGDSLKAHGVHRSIPSLAERLKSE
ncbi:hypothetical protein [Sulfitobacter sp. JB4-11]|uniref:hypothetical protein n=1 Tax=Sulfitobacter rhodophyticola TaxID=3238304 RepID=UPI003512CDF0